MVCTFDFETWFCGTYFHVGIQMFPIAGKFIVMTTFLSLSHLSLPIKCKVMFLGRNSFPETELIQLQLLNFLGAFSLIFENEFCALQGAESEKYNFFLQRYKTGSIMLG